MKIIFTLLLVTLVALSWSYAQDCPNCSAQNRQPVCAVNGRGNRKTFPNSCFVDSINCEEGQNYRIVSSGAC
ncbi:vasotab-like [Agrilus planipennis]|uniref:Vasotab-like n=1 Tax=Agrilus planipennis TaxID=224129 RepID=A0A1W4X4F6_AGRPL|nr:vasotab-like [Agrilus planipennis]